MTITETENRSGQAAESLRGRVALGTGGTRGIGAAISKRLADAGAPVAVIPAFGRARTGPVYRSLQLATRPTDPMTARSCLSILSAWSGDL